MEVRNARNTNWDDMSAKVDTVDRTSFKIKKNLHDGLKRLRGKYGNVCLWVDAICIDQSSEGAMEKEAQIAMMARIYDSAAAVCVWLGEDLGAEAKIAF